jgi:serine/threonine-protein kinase
MKVCPVCQLCYEDTDTTCDQEEHGGLVTARLGTRLIADKYRLDRLLARGGMGAVYSGTHVELDRPVAIKLLLPNLNADTQAFERFRREARAAARVKHQNVADIYDYGVLADDEAYIVMELVEGETLHERLKRDGQLMIAETVAISKQIAEGLEAAHYSGIIHRDLKPSNIILNQDAVAGTRVKIIDFGIAKISEQINTDDSTLTATGMLVGTPRYMSPEQCLGEELDARSDIYSYGVIVYEMLAGRPPFDSTSAVAIAFKHIHEPPPPLEEHRRNVPPPMAKLIADSLSIDPAGRPQTATELKQRLGQVESSLGQYAGRDQVVRAASPREEVDEFRTQIQEKRDQKEIAASVLADEYATEVMAANSGADTGKPQPFFHFEKEGIQQAVPLKPASPTSGISPHSATTVIADDDDQTRVRRRRRPAFAYAGLAAALVICVAILWAAAHRTASKSSVEVAATSATPATTNSPKPLPSPAASASTKSGNKPAEQVADDQRADASLPDDASGTGSEEARTEINGALDEWVAATNAGDVEKQMTFYNPSVEAFYRTRNVSSDDVRAEKERLFEQADKIEVHAGEPEIKFSRDGQTASTRFRKRYVIEGPEQNRRGEVLQELRWKKTDKGWKIVSERDLRVLQKAPKPQPLPPPPQANNSMWPHQVVMRGFKKLFQPNR